MTPKQTSTVKLLVLDVDNTVFDWVTYYVAAFTAMLQKVTQITGIPFDLLQTQARDVFTVHGSIEYPFLVQELPAVMDLYGADVESMLKQVVGPSREAFLVAAAAVLKPYAGVEETLQAVKKNFSDVPIVALTDAPRYVAMWKLNKLGLLSCFSAVYGLSDPRLPTCPTSGKVKVDPEILLKHLQQANFGFAGRIRILPEDYEKPGTKGLKTVLMDYELDEDLAHRQQVLWVGDNLRKDVGLGKRLGVRTAWASYGARLDPVALQKLSAFSSQENVQKNMNSPTVAPDAVQPDLVLKEFRDLLQLFAAP